MNGAQKSCHKSLIEKFGHIEGLKIIDRKPNEKELLQLKRNDCKIVEAFDGDKSLGVAVWI